MAGNDGWVPVDAGNDGWVPVDAGAPAVRWTDRGKPAVAQPYPEDMSWLTRHAPPPSGNISWGAQTLWNMASDPDTRRKILEDTYGPDNVKQDERGLYAETPRGILRPGAGGEAGIRGWLEREGALATSEMLPTAGAVGGSVLGAPFGPAAAAAGSGSGLALGTQLNDTILALAGYPSKRSFLEETGRTAAKVGEGAVMELGGRAVGTAVGSAVSALKAGQALGIKPAAQQAMRYFTGMTHDIAERVLPLAEKGVRVPPEMWAPETPAARMLMNVAKRFGHDPVTPSVERYAQDEITALLERRGVPASETGPVTGRTAAVDFAPAGEAMHRKYAETLAETDAKVNRAFDAYEESLASVGQAAEKHRGELLAAAKAALDENRTAAQQTVDAAWGDIQTRIAALRDGIAQGKPGDLVRYYANEITALRHSLGNRFSDIYGDIDRLAGDTRFPASDLAESVQRFMSQLPEDLQRAHPQLVQVLSKLEENPTLSYGEAHHLRSMLRHAADWQTLSPDFRNGQMKYFARVLDDTLHNPMNPPVVRDAVGLLDKTDAAYAKEMARFKDPTVQKLVDWTEANMPPSATAASREILKPGAEETRRELRNIGGPKAWDAVVGADMQAALDASKTVVPGQYDGGAFVKEFLHRDRAGILADYPKDAADLLRRQAQYVQAIAGDGKLDVNLLATDSFTVAMRKAADAARRVEELSKSDPLGSMETEIKRLRSEHAAAVKASGEARATDPLHKILGNESALVAKSAESIARNSELTVAAAERFGKDSPEFQAVRSAWLRDALTATETRGLRGMKKTVTDLTPDQQELYFGATKDDALLLVGNLHDLMASGEDFGSALFGAGIVQHPGSAPLPGAKALKPLPGFVGRALVSPMLDLASDMMTRPGLVKFVAGNLRGTAEEQAFARDLIKRYANLGGRAASGAGAFAVSLPGQDGRPQAPAYVGWRARIGPGAADAARALGVQPGAGGSP